MPLTGLNQKISVTETQDVLMRRYTFTNDYKIAHVRYSEVFQKYSIDINGFDYQTKDKGAVISLLNHMMG